MSEIRIEVGSSTRGEKISPNVKCKHKLTHWFAGAHGFGTQEANYVSWSCDVVSVMHRGSGAAGRLWRLSEKLLPRNHQGAPRPRALRPSVFANLHRCYVCSGAGIVQSVFSPSISLFAVNLLVNMILQLPEYFYACIVFKCFNHVNPTTFNFIILLFNEMKIHKFTNVQFT